MMKNNDIVLMFHDVYESSPFESGFANETANLFKIQKDKFYFFLDLIESKLKQQNRMKVGVVFTFDDGGKSSLWIAKKLSDRGFIGNFFIVTSLIGTEGFCSESDLKEIAKLGHIIGTHSHTHPILINKLSHEELLDEWRTSKNILQNILGKEIHEASIPGGFYSSDMGNIISNLGLKKIYTSIPSKQISRIGFSEVIGRFTIRGDYPIEKYLKYFDRFSILLFKVQVRSYFLEILKKNFGNTFLKVRKLYYQNKSIINDL